MRDKQYYQERFKGYLDVVTLQQFKEMLGGIADSTARKLMRENRVKHFYIRETYMIPKEYVIEYVLGEHYEEYKYCLNVQI
jgi:hypothetical protein